jgi:hypothetical protein
MGQPEYSALHQDEEQAAQYGPPIRGVSTRSRIARSPIFYILDIALAIAVGVLIFRQKSYERVQKFDLNGDITGYAPSIDYRLVTFIPEPQFYSNHTSLESLREAREHWKTIVPRESGPDGPRD